MGTPVLPGGLCTKNAEAISLFSETPEGMFVYFG
jgi:hypothetical protein